MKVTVKSKKFLFVYPDFEYNITKDGMKVEPGGWYHEGISQLSSILEELGWKVELLHLTKPIEKKAFIKEIKKYDPDIIGFSVRTGVRKYSEKIIGWADKLNKFIIAGSYHPSLWPQEVIKWKGIDAICIGEGENPVKILIEKINKNQPIEKTGSMWFRVGKRIVKNAVIPFVIDLDSLPLPKFDIFDFKKLIPSQIKAAIVVLTRGCPYNCTYCWNNFARNLYPNKHQYVRYKSPKVCIKYIKKLKQNYPEALSFRFQDDLWPFYNDWFSGFSQAYIKKINMPFECHLRANLLNEEIIKTLKEMRCFGVYFGVESGNKYIRNQILKRGMSEETIIHAFLTCRKYKIKTHAYNIVGLPHENMRKVLDTIKLNAKIKPSDMFFPIYFPYAGSDLYHIAIKGGFFDPGKQLDPYVNIEMPDFKRNQIRFASLYSKTFVRLYQFVYNFPKLLSTLPEKILDFLWLFPYWPFPILNAWIIFKRKTETKIKTFIKTNVFWLYLLIKGKDFKK